MTELMTELIELAPSNETAVTSGAAEERHRRNIRVKAASRVRSGIAETTTDGNSELTSEWTLSLAFSHPGTLTEAEARDTFNLLMARQARTRCHLIIEQLSDNVVTIVLPQLEELAAYEEKIYQLRKEKHLPNIRERWIALPAAP